MKLYFYIAYCLFVFSISLAHSSNKEIICTSKDKKNSVTYTSKTSEIRVGGTFFSFNPNEDKYKYPLEKILNAQLVLKAVECKLSTIHNGIDCEPDFTSKKFALRVSGIATETLFEKDGQIKRMKINKKVIFEIPKGNKDSFVMSMISIIPGEDGAFLEGFFTAQVKDKKGDIIGTRLEISSNRPWYALSFDDCVMKGLE